MGFFSVSSGKSAWAITDRIVKVLASVTAQTQSGRLNSLRFKPLPPIFSSSFSFPFVCVLFLFYVYKNLFVLHFNFFLLVVVKVIQAHIRL